MPKDFEVPDFFTPNPRRKQELENFFNQMKKFWGYIFLAIILIFFLSGALVRVGAGERAVVFNIFTGVEKHVLGEGIHIIIPLVQHATLYDVKELAYNFASEDKNRQGLLIGEEIHSLTSDGQKVDIELTVRARPIPSELWELHKFIGPEYVYKIIIPKVRTTLREVLANYPVEDVYSGKRQEIQNKIQEELKDNLAKNYFLHVEEALIRNVRFSKEFQDAIDRKQQAYQEYLKMEYILEGEKAKRDAKILKAEGEANAINLKVNALRANPDFIRYRRAQIFGQKAKIIFTEDLN